MEHGSDGFSRVEAGTVDLRPADAPALVGRGQRREADINETYVQPFMGHTTQDAWTFGINSESSYYWTDNEASVPINVSATKLFRLGGAALSIGPGVRYRIEAPEGAAHGWGFRFETTLIFPDAP